MDSKPVTVRLSSADLAALDAWIAERRYLPSRPEAIRQLMREALLQKKLQHDKVSRAPARLLSSANGNAKI